MSALQLFPRIVDFISDPEGFAPEQFDLTKPVQPIPEKGFFDLTFFRRLVEDGNSSVTPGRKITFFLRDLLLTLQSHPAIESTLSWNVDLHDGFNVYLIVSRSATERSVSALTPEEGHWEGTEEEALIIVYGVARVLSLLHSHGIFHGNPHADFVFLDEQNSPRLGGFGWLRSVKLGQEATKEGDITDLAQFCDYFLLERADGSFTPVGSFKDWIQNSDGEESTTGFYRFWML
jgi:serine/threonine protein kinase